MIIKVAVSKHPPRCVGGSPSKKRWLNMPEELESRGEKVQTQKAPMGGMEKVLWAVAHAIEGLVSGQAAITKELVELWKSALCSEEHFELIADNMKSMEDSMEMFTRGDQYLRVREMGKLEVPEGPVTFHNTSVTLLTNLVQL